MEAGAQDGKDHSPSGAGFLPVKQGLSGVRGGVGECDGPELHVSRKGFGRHRTGS